MHHAAPHPSFTAPPVAQRARASSLRLIGAAIAAACGLLAIALLDPGVDAGVPPAAMPVAAFAAAGSTSALGRDPSVPDAAGVLADREPAVEEPAPTF
jgi:hypothetical protein